MTEESPKIFVLDTNVILHDSSCIYHFHSHDVIIPITVIEELDRFKKGNDSLNFHARAFLRSLDSLSGDKLFEDGVRIGPILASVSCDFLAPVNFPETVSVGAHVTRIGRSSFNLGYVVRQHSDQRVVATGDSVVVQLNYETGRSEPFSDALRRDLKSLVAI